MAIAESGGGAGSATTASMRLLLVNSAIAFAIALILMITVHELGHAVAGLAFGLQPKVFPGQVDYAIAGTTNQRVLCALAGPVVSLVIGVVVLLTTPAPRGFWGLLLFWFGTLNVQEFTGYLMTGPFLAVGDIGQALHLLSAPWWAYLAVFIAGTAGTVLLGRIATRRLMAMTDPGAGNRAGQLRCLGLFAWLLGSALVILPGILGSSFGQVFTLVGFIELLATLTSGIFLTLVRFFMGREEVPGRGLSVGWPVVGIGLLVVVVVARQLILGPGLTL
jgi:hypothetical protein